MIHAIITGVEKTNWLTSRDETILTDIFKAALKNQLQIHNTESSPQWGR